MGTKGGVVLKKVLFVSHSGKLSGANLSFVSIITNLKEKIDITVLVNDNNSELTRTLDRIGVKHICCNYSWWVAHKRTSPVKQLYRYLSDACQYWKGATDKQLEERFKGLDFDVVYTNTSTVDVGARISQILGIPHIWHVREFGGEDFGFIPLVSKKKRKKAFICADRIIAISYALEESLINKYPGVNTTVIHNGFNISELFYERMHDRKETINILITGQVTEGKGQIQAIKAIKELNMQDNRFVLNMAGDIDKDYLSECLEGQQCPEWLNILGKVNNLFELRKEMDIELVCSKSEAFGRVTIEAMLHSVPVVGANTGATKELLTDCHGIIYEYGSIDDLKNKILILANDVALATSLANNARTYASKYTIEKCADAVYKIIAGID